MALVSKTMFYIAFSDNNAKVGETSIALKSSVTPSTATPVLRAAYEGITNGLTKEVGFKDRLRDENRLIAPKTSNKNHKWRIFMRDVVTGHISTQVVHTADGSLRADDSDLLDTTLEAYTNLKTAIESNCFSPEGHAVVMTDVLYE